jgi:hypothetical protein
MKKILLFLINFLVVFILLSINSIDNQPLAQKGCCRQRSNTNDPHWYENGLSFRQCRDLNRQRDNDDLYRRSGIVWWDENC